MPCIGRAIALAHRVKRLACCLVRDEAYRGARRRRVGGKPRLGEPQKEGESQQKKEHPA
jgi:hypothetical protein